MALRIGLVLRNEFLLLVIRQLLRRQVGVELVGEADGLAEAAALSVAGLLLIEHDLAARDPVALAPLLRRDRARPILVGEGALLTPPPGVDPDSILLLPASGATGKIDAAVLGARLEELLKPLRSMAVPPVDEPESPPACRMPPPRRPAVIGIAASTGGPEALQELLTVLAPPVCPILVALHIPAGHTLGLARHLSAVTGHVVGVGEAGPLPERGVVLLQGGCDHAVIASADGLSLKRVRGGASVFHPNGDILLTSIAALDRAAVGIILTGMGSDGGEGAQALAGRDHPVLVQRPSSCVVAGMPSAAIACGAASEIASLRMIAARLNSWFALSNDS
jgi:two-component system chemotaxis response regulator CheB